mmetsp:Transcript_8295/g.12712  ORF Transcript_8295/g.12712 Transcript_8295/m.12712 type:complete len:203 (-) Transcript_8295:264-872(-)
MSLVTATASGCLGPSSPSSSFISSPVNCALASKGSSSSSASFSSTFSSSSSGRSSTPNSVCPKLASTSSSLSGTASSSLSLFSPGIDSSVSCVSFRTGASVESSCRVGVGTFPYTTSISSSASATVVDGRTFKADNTVLLGDSRAVPGVPCSSDEGVCFKRGVCEAAAAVDFPFVFRRTNGAFFFCALPTLSALVTSAVSFF